MSFLPVTREEMKKRQWDEIDIVLVSGDAYVDHPSFGIAVIGRMLEHQGYHVGIIAMPDWKDPASIKTFGKPRLFFGVSSGAVDSMVSRYTAFKRARNKDPYAPGGMAGRKPEKAILVYCNLIKAAYKDVPIVIGGLEASMRRFVHYDFWSNKVRRSIIEDSRANILVYGMGEYQIVEIAKRLSNSSPLSEIPGAVIITKESPIKNQTHKNRIKILPDEENAVVSKSSFIDFYKSFYENQDKLLIQQAGKRYIVQYPCEKITTEQLDAVYELPFTRQPHPVYKNQIPAFEMIKNSLTSHRGCFSGCSFCSLSLHQGKRIISRSSKSLMREVRLIASDKNFKGHISDIGGPSANMYGFNCVKQWQCKRVSCTFPSLCNNLLFGAKSWVKLLEDASRIKNVQRVTIGSGIRYDILMKEKNPIHLLKKITRSHISGQLKIAPEHTSLNVLAAMRKTSLFNLKTFIDIYNECNAKIGKKQYLIPYLMSNHPGCEKKDMLLMKKNIKSLFGFLPEQAQSFIPLPMTLSSVIYYTEIDPLTKKEYVVQKDTKERRKQHNIFFDK